MIEILTGIVSGFISGMGMGGGTILILILSVFLGVEQHRAQATNLVFFIPTSIIAIITNIKQKSINFKIGIPIAVTGVIGAVIGAMISAKLNVIQLKRCFGIFLMIIAIVEIYSIIKKYRYDKKRHNNNRIKRQRRRKI